MCQKFHSFSFTICFLHRHPLFVLFSTVALLCFLLFVCVPGLVLRSVVIVQLTPSVVFPSFVFSLFRLALRQRFRSVHVGHVYPVTTAGFLRGISSCATKRVLIADSQALYLVIPIVLDNSAGAPVRAIGNVSWSVIHGGKCIGR